MLQKRKKTEMITRKEYQKNVQLYMPRSQEDGEKDFQQIHDVESSRTECPIEIQLQEDKGWSAIQLLYLVQLFFSSCPTPQTVATRLLCPWHFPSENTKVGCRILFQGIFLTQGSNLFLLYWQVGSLLLRNQGRPKGVLGEGNCSGVIQVQSSSFPRQTIQYHSNPSLGPNQ